MQENTLDEEGKEIYGKLCFANLFVLKGPLLLLLLLFLFKVSLKIRCLKYFV